MAGSEEKRRRILWFHARLVFFLGGEDTAFADGLALARDCHHEDARLLVSLFAGGAPVSREEAASVFLSRGPDDARCLCWAALCGGQPRAELLKRSAEAGNAWGQAVYDWSCTGGTEFLAKSAEQGDRDGMYYLGWRLRCESQPVPAANDLWRESGLLGHPSAQYVVGRDCVDGSNEQFEWWQRSALQGAHSLDVREEIGRQVITQLQLFRDGGSGRILFELGSMFRGAVDTKKRQLFGVDRHVQVVAGSKRAVALFVQWCGEARQAIWCWIWLAQQLGMSRDMRVHIAGIVWEQRAAWSERKRGQ